MFFHQQLVGIGGKLFKLLKFATCSRTAPIFRNRDGHEMKGRIWRVLPFGKFLRATKINPLPQLLNILKGDMSVIGPAAADAAVFDGVSGPISQAEIVKVRAGLVGGGFDCFSGGGVR